MISGIDPSGAQFLADLAQTKAKMERAERELASGLKFNDASDAPDQVSDILTLRADISRNTQVTSNLSNVKTQVVPPSRPSRAPSSSSSRHAPWRRKA